MKKISKLIIFYLDDEIVDWDFGCRRFIENLTKMQDFIHLDFNCQVEVRNSLLWIDKTLCNDSSHRSERNLYVLFTTCCDLSDRSRFRLFSSFSWGCLRSFLSCLNSLWSRLNRSSYNILSDNSAIWSRSLDLVKWNTLFISDGLSIRTSDNSVRRFRRCWRFLR